MRTRVQLLLLSAVLCAGLCAAAGLAPATTGPVPGDLLIEVRCETLDNARWLSRFDVRLAAPGRLLIQASPGEAAAIAGAGLGYSVLGAVDEEAEYFCCSTTAPVPDGFSVVWTSRRDKVQVLAGRARGGAFPFAGHIAVPLPHNAAATSWFPAPAPEAARGRRPGALARLAAAQVDPQNIENIIDDLSYDASADTIRTRYSFRTETVEIAMPYVRDLLAANLGAGGTVQLQEFPLRSGENPPMGYNIIGTLAGSVEGAGYYVISGHYDSIALRTEYGDGREWDGMRDPAPGADDNASGVAAVLECARVLAEVPLDLGLKFILFSGEEEGIVGSTYYVAHMVEDPVEGPLLGAFNADMVAYNPGGDTLQVVTDELSSWMADFVIEAYPELAAEIGDLALSSAMLLRHPFSDDSAFQLKGYPGITLIENRDIEISNPYYHTIYDDNLGGKLNISQATKAAKLISGALAALAGRQEAPDLEVLPTDIVFGAAGVSPAKRADVGDTVTVSVRVRNAGGPSDQGIVGLRLYDGNPDHGGELLAQETYEAPLPALGGHVFKVLWLPGERDRGSHSFTALVDLDGQQEADLTNNRAVASFAVVDRTMDLIESYVLPNPVGPGGDAVFHYFLTQPAGVTIEVFDVMGRVVGSAGRPMYGGRIPGVNFMEVAVPIGDVIDDPADLPDGVYFFRIAADDGAMHRERSGRFILVR